ncbi:hypothetical protein [uncultured Campylobacter sp.]|uniref:hypothetical protein n=1 Tax=uncultured Campylobacter sp. TaxID=218934 RepID=UPI00263875FD|nr:hypothetical protein [uncultured Campylobacter sp.]
MDFAINNEIKPAINQIECNPFHQKLATQANLKELGIVMQSWRRLARAERICSATRY